MNLYFVKRKGDKNGFCVKAGSLTEAVGVTLHMTNGDIASLKFLTVDKPFSEIVSEVDGRISGLFMDVLNLTRAAKDFGEREIGIRNAQSRGAASVEVQCHQLRCQVESIEAKLAGIRDELDFLNSLSDATPAGAGSAAPDRG